MTVATIPAVPTTIFLCLWSCIGIAETNPIAPNAINTRTRNLAIILYSNIWVRKCEKIITSSCLQYLNNFKLTTVHLPCKNHKSITRWLSSIFSQIPKGMVSKYGSYLWFGRSEKEINANETAFHNKTNDVYNHNNEIIPPVADKRWSIVCVEKAV